MLSAATFTIGKTGVAILTYTREFKILTTDYKYGTLWTTKYE